MEDDFGIEIKTIFSIFFTGLIVLLVFIYLNPEIGKWTLAIWIASQTPLISKRFRGYSGLLTFRIGVPYIITIFVYIIYMMSTKIQFINVYARLLYDDWNTINACFTVISTLYAITFAFCLWKAMIDFDDLKNSLRDEANKIQSIATLLRYFDNVYKEKTQEYLEKIRKELTIYTKSMIDNPNLDKNDENGKIIISCVDHIEYLEFDKLNDRIALENIIKNFDELTMIRSHRISCLNNNMSPFLFVIIAIMSASIVALFFVRNPIGFNSNQFIVPLLTFIYSYLFIMLWDLDQPFDGFWRISNDAFRQLNLDLRDQEI